MLRTYGRIVEPGGDRVRRSYLARFILQDVRISALQDARQSTAKSCCMFAQSFAATARFNADEANSLVLQELVKNANGVRPSSNAGAHGHSPLPPPLHALPPRP